MSFDDREKHPHLTADHLEMIPTGEIRVKWTRPMQVAYVVHVGPYHKVGETLAKLHEWIVANGYEVAGGPGHIYHDDPDKVPEHELVTEVFWPIRKPSQAKP